MPTENAIKWHNMLKLPLVNKGLQQMNTLEYKNDIKIIVLLM